MTGILVHRLHNLLAPYILAITADTPSGTHNVLDFYDQALQGAPPRH